MSGAVGSTGRASGEIRHLRVAGRLQHAGAVTRPALVHAAVAAAAAAAGCFYVTPINDRPSAELRKVLPTSTPFRGDTVQIEVDAIDPNGDAMNLSWRAFACAPGATACAAEPYITGIVDPSSDPSVSPKFSVIVLATEQTRAVKIVVHVEDTYGAPALQDPELTVDVANHPPAITFQVGTPGPPGAPTRITARATDEDDTLDRLTFVDWAITAQPFPSDGALTFVDDNSDNPDRVSADEIYDLLPDAEGTWEVSVTVEDPLGIQTVETQPVLIGTDQPPCIADVFPAAPPAGNTMPLDMLRRFEVVNVEDDLDLYPAPDPDDPFYGAATFTWSLASPGSGGYQVIAGAIDHAYELDPAAYDPGDAVFLRVEIADRIARTLPCPPGDLTCAIDPAADPPCVQRLTWALEVP
jgi:hypothetical protein